MGKAVDEPTQLNKRIELNKSRTILLLGGASCIWLPFGTASSYGIIRILALLTRSSIPAATLLWLVAGLSLISLSLPWLLYLRMASSPLRTLDLCGPLLLRTPTQDARQILAALATDAGLPAPRLFVLDSPSPNALAAGVQPSKAMVVVTRGLLQLLERRELEAVLAHELAHIAEQDTRMDAAVTAVAIFLRVPTLLLQKSPQRHTLNPICLLLLPFAPALMLAAPLLATLLRSLASEHKEPPDCRDPEGLMKALARIWGSGSRLPLSDPVIAHGFFADPGPPGPLRAFGGRLLNVHQPMSDRLAALNGRSIGMDHSAIEALVAFGKDFAAYRMASGDSGLEAQGSQSADRVFMQGNRACLARRVAGPSSDVYEAESMHSSTVARVAPGDLVISFHTEGVFQQVVTSAGTFGFLPRTVKLERTDRLPPEVLQGAVDPRPETEPGHQFAAWEMFLAAAFAAAVFAAVLVVKMISAKP